jgi:pyruvate ferredoxin oxidoreductase gamma subunit
MTEIVWHGRGGQGAFTAARLLGTAASLYGDTYALAFPTFGPERRGAPMLSFTKIDKSPIADRSEITLADIRVYLDSSLYDQNTYQASLKENGIIIVNGKSSGAVISHNSSLIRIDVAKIAFNILGKPIVNTAMLGVLAAMSSIVSIASIENAIRSEMAKALAEKNILLLHTAYESVRSILNLKKGSL